MSSAYSKSSILLKTLYNKIQKWMNKEKSSNDFLYILEPLSCVIRIGLLSYKPDGSKISISNNKIYYNEPYFKELFVGLMEILVMIYTTFYNH